MDSLYVKIGEVQSEMADPSFSEKRFISSPLVSNLTSSQFKVYSQLQLFAESIDKNFMLLQGYAGTGKTYTLTMFIEWYLYVHRKKVAMTAPTNKAVKVLQRMAEYSDVNLSYLTLHSLLGLTEQIDGYGKQIFVQNNRESCKAGDYSLIVIDEASMIADELLIGNKHTSGLFEYAEQFGFKILFVGDPMQVPPVNKSDCIPMSAEMREEIGIDMVELTEVVRQGKDNPIIRKTIEVRERIKEKEVITERDDEYNTDTLKGVFFLDYEKKKEFLYLLNKLYNSDNFKSNADFVKVLAWRNVTVNSMNNRIRKMIYGKDAPKICIGEKLVVNQPILDEYNEAVLFTTNDELTVENFSIQKAAYKGVELTYYSVTVSSVGKKSTNNIRIIHEESQEDFDTLLSYFKEEALKEKKGSWEAASKWKDYFNMVRCFADVNYNYCITVHKAQGSTFVNAFVLEEDISMNRKVLERNRIKYTAFTRPSERLFIVT